MRKIEKYLFKITEKYNVDCCIDWDFNDNVVLCAHSERHAKYLHKRKFKLDSDFDSSKISIQLIGIADKSIKKGDIILSTYPPPK
jgi:hypothetical protein